MFVNDGIEVDLDPHLILQAPTQVLVTHVGSALFGPTYRPSIFSPAEDEPERSLSLHRGLRRPFLTLPYITSLDELQPWFREITRNLHRMHCLPLPMDRIFMDDLVLSEFVFHEPGGPVAAHGRQGTSAGSSLAPSANPSPHPPLASLHPSSIPETAKDMGTGDAGRSALHSSASSLSVASGTGSLSSSHSVEARSLPKEHAL